MLELNIMQTNIKLGLIVLEIHLHELNLIQNKAEIPKQIKPNQMQVKENLQHNNMRTIIKKPKPKQLLKFHTFLTPDQLYYHSIIEAPNLKRNRTANDEAMDL